MECTLAANIIGPEGPLAAPGPARASPADARTPRNEFVVITRSDGLLEQLGQVLDGIGEVRHAESAQEARQSVDPRHATVMLLDARDHDEPGPEVERLHSTDGTTVIVVFAPAEAATDVARAIRGSAAFAVLPIPVEPEKTRVVLQGAGEEALARRSLVPPADQPAPVRAVPPPRSPDAPWSPDRPVLVATPDVDQPVSAGRPQARAPGAAGGGARRASGVPRIAIAAALALAVIATGAWLFLRDEARTPAAAPATAAAPPVAGDLAATNVPPPVVASPSETPLSSEPKEQLLDRARAAFHERRYTDPEGDNALHYYRSVLAQDPQDGEAREGLDRIGAVLDGRLAAALAADHFDDAAVALEQLRTIRPDDPARDATEARLAERRIAAALAREDVEQATELMQAADRAGVAPQRLAPLREQLARLDSAQRAERLSRLVAARIRDGQLLAPPGDSAKHHLGQLLRLPNGKRLGAAASEQLARAYADRAQQAAAQGQGAEARQWLAEARELGYEPARLAAPAAVPRATTMAAPAPASPPRPSDAVASGQPDVAAARTAAPESAPASQATYSAADFKRRRYVAPVYPAHALALGQAGEVRVRLTVGTDGHVADVQVLTASPAGVFEQAAVNAVRKWRFDPIVKNGRAIEATVATTISFRPDDTGRR